MKPKIKNNIILGKRCAKDASLHGKLHCSEIPLPGLWHLSLYTCHFERIAYQAFSVSHTMVPYYDYAPVCLIDTKEPSHNLHAVLPVLLLLAASSLTVFKMFSLVLPSISTVPLPFFVKHRSNVDFVD